VSNFLEQTAQHLITTYGEKISDVCIVLPNKRAGLFLKQHLSKLIDKPIWLPPIIGAEDLIEQLADKEIIDNLTQLFELYEVYLKTVTEPESFEEFSKWGQMLLHDFNEIDRYLIPVDKLYEYINEARAIEVWNLGEEITDFQSQYLMFWKQMGGLYKAYKQHLHKANKAYQGAAFRIVAEDIVENPTLFISDKIKWSKIIFAGFNALTAAEETLITTLIKEGKAEILWDADEYYLEDKYQESGLFLRKFKEKAVFSPFNWVSNKFKTEQKNINILGIPQNIGQAKYLANIFAELQNDNNFEDTAVVLADENLLIPVLQSLPESVDTINVTMGYPLKNTPLNNFFEIYFTTVLNAERFGKKEQLTYHYNDILKLVQLPFSQVVFGEENCSKIKQQIIKNNWVFINKDKLDFINELLPIKLSTTYSINELLANCLQFVEKGKAHYINTQKETNNKLELEYLFLFSKLFNQLIELNQKYPFLTEIKSFYSVYRQLLSSLSIELYGEPLKGLQVMGMLETRNIDFKNVILLSTNEGMLPSGKSFNSFVPFDIKNEYHLPTHVEKDAIYAYHFYRLVQNAENMYIMYNTESGSFTTGEQSRFVTQIENELSDFENINITKKIITYPTLKNTTEKISVEKSPKILVKIEELFERGVSPTALNTYINCPLDFYYKYVIGVREADDVEETIDHSSFGTYIHRVLEILYQPFANQKTNITVEDVKGLLKKAPDVALQVFSENMSERELKSGKNLLTFSVAQNYINTFLKNEINFIKKSKDDLYIKLLEQSLEGSLQLNGNTIKLKGTADRVDTFGNTLRIIDYKTGLVNVADLKIKSVEELKVGKKSKAFQILMYAYLYAQQNELSNTQLHSGIISFRVLSKGFMPFILDKEKEISEEVLTDFETVLKEIFTEILDPAIPFMHQATAQYCEFCE
jgi:CRISPR/Cas system-associated exonuclease Cas4 (RecB family)